MSFVIAQSGLRQIRQEEAKYDKPLTTEIDNVGANWPVHLHGVYMASVGWLTPV